MPFVLSRVRVTLLALVALGAAMLTALHTSGGTTAVATVRPAAKPSTTTTSTTAPPTTTTTAPPPTTEAPPPTEPPAPPATHTRVTAAPPAPAPDPAPEPAPAPTSNAAPSQAARSLALLNSWRQQNGLAPLAVASDAQAKAQQHAEEMAAAGKLWHTNLQSGVNPGWSAWAENVGDAGSADEVHQMFMASSGHNANMLATNMTHVGVGAAIGADGNVYICQEFVG